MDLSYLYPTGLVLYSNDVVVNFSGGNKNPPAQGQRQKVTEFTRKSRARLAFVASNTEVVFTSMMTLTYPREWPHDGKVVKANLKAMINRVRRKVGGFDYLWFLEFQKRGAPHVHLLLSCKSSRDRKSWLSQSWHDIVNKDVNESHLKAGTRWTGIRKRNGARNYCVKYAQKMEQKNVPALYQNVGRFWGHSKPVKPRPMFPAIEIYSLEQMRHYLSQWEYVAKVDKPLKVLYNAAVPLAEQLTLDGIELNRVD